MFKVFTLHDSVSRQVGSNETLTFAKYLSDLFITHYLSGMCFKANVFQLIWISA